MARANKYASVNFNLVHEKSLTRNSNSPNNPSKNPNSSSSSSGPFSTISSPNAYKNHLSSSRTHGRMLVLTRPVPSTVTLPLSPSPQTTPTHQSQIRIPDHPRAEPDTVADSISLRPLGRTGGLGSVSSPVLVPEREKEFSPLVGSPKPHKFVPPHLRPGFVGREERPGSPPVFRGKKLNQIQLPVHQHRYGEEGRPKSGGYDRRGRVGEMDPGFVNRPRSSENRPVSSG